MLGCFVEATVLSINYDHFKGNQEVKSVTIRRKQCGETLDLPASDVVIAAGPWTKTLLPDAPVGGEKSHSIVVKPPRSISSTILFFDPGHLDDDKKNQLEIYPRPDDTVYLSGQTDYGLQIPSSSDDVHPGPRCCKELMNNVGIVSPLLHKSKVTVQQARFRPIVNVRDRDPELGPLLGFTGITGLILAAGHNQWGIQNAPITGKVVSELIFQGMSHSADIRELDPRPHLKGVDATSGAR